MHPEKNKDPPTSIPLNILALDMSGALSSSYTLILVLAMWIGIPSAARVPASQESSSSMLRVLFCAGVRGLYNPTMTFGMESTERSACVWLQRETYIHPNTVHRSFSYFVILVFLADRRCSRYSTGRRISRIAPHGRSFALSFPCSCMLIVVRRRLAVVSSNEGKGTRRRAAAVVVVLHICR